MAFLRGWLAMVLLMSMSISRTTYINGSSIIPIALYGEIKMAIRLTTCEVPASVANNSI